MAALLAVVALGTAAWTWDRVRPYPPVRPGDAARGAKAFLDSDLGSKLYSSFPRVVWEAIPVIFPQLLPEGWRGVGLLPRPEDPDGPPVGMVRASLLGLELYASNCALCHVGRFQGKLLIGAPNPDLDIQYMVWVLGEALRSETFHLEAIAQVAASRGKPLEGLQRQEVRLWLALARWKLGAARPFSGTAGPGRSDNLNGYKRMFGLPDAERPAMVDLANVFNQRVKTRALVDGSISGDHAARIMLTEFQKGRSARDALRHREVFEDLVAYLEGPLEPPRYPFAIDGGLAEQGHRVFRTACSRCHGTYPPDAPSYPNLRVPVTAVGTDPARALSMSEQLVSGFHATDFRDYLTIDPQPVYVPTALGGLWTSAPYLHNGSVPTLWHLLNPSQRPVAFYRRWNEFDPTRVGFVCPEQGLECGADPTQRSHDPRTIVRFDTRAPGNGNGGHLYGHELAEADKAALLEYLKTL